MSSNEIDLKRQDLAVLHVISESTRPITTTTIRESIHWADSSRVIRYRLDRLEERDLIETCQDESRAEPHQMPPRVAITTDAGDNIAAEYDDDPETLPLEERVARIEKQHKRMMETYSEAKRRIVDVEEEVKSLDEDVEDLAEELHHVKQYLDSPTSAGDRT